MPRNPKPKWTFAAKAWAIGFIPGLVGLWLLIYFLIKAALS